MHVAVIVVLIFVAVAPSRASNSCMTKTKARQHFGTTNLYWHGPDHCWDATPVRRLQVLKIQPKSDQRAQQEDHQSGWRDAMSEMLPAEPSVQPLGDQTLEKSDAINVVGTKWLDRWVDLTQVVPSLTIGRKPDPVAMSPTAERASEPIVTPHIVILACLSFIVILVTIEFLFRGAARNTRSP